MPSKKTTYGGQGKAVGCVSPAALLSARSQLEVQKLLLILPSVDARHAIVESRSHRRRCSLWWRKPLSEALGEHTVVDLFFIGLAVIAGTGAVFFLFVIEPRRKIYDYDPGDPR